MRLKGQSLLQLQEVIKKWQKEAAETTGASLQKGFNYPKGNKNIICTMVKYGVTFYGRHTTRNTNIYQLCLNCIWIITSKFLWRIRRYVSNSKNINCCKFELLHTPLLRWKAILRLKTECRMSVFHVLELTHECTVKPQSLENRWLVYHG